MNTQVRLLGARRFMPLFATQTTGAFNDNLFKSAFVMLVTYGTTMRTGYDPGVLAAMAGGALIAPYFLFSALAGELADRFERARLLQILKAAELVAVLGAATRDRKSTRLNSSHPSKPYAAFCLKKNHQP